MLNLDPMGIPAAQHCTSTPMMIDTTRQVLRDFPVLKLIDSLSHSYAKFCSCSSILHSLFPTM